MRVPTDLLEVLRFPPDVTHVRVEYVAEAERRLRERFAAMVRSIPDRYAERVLYLDATAARERCEEIAADLVRGLRSVPEEMARDGWTPTGDPPTSTAPEE